MQKEIPQTINTSLATGRILLLADDGRMAGLLRNSLGDYSVHTETHVLQGILQLSKNSFDLILLNVESLESKTAEAVKAIRTIALDTPILLYGRPFAECYANQALRDGADDFLVWPIPVSEIRSHLQKKNAPFPNESDQEIVSSLPKKESPSQERIEFSDRSEAGIADIHAKLILDYQHLAQLIPQGKDILIQEIQKRLAKSLQIQWIRIQLAGSENAGSLKPSGLSFSAKLEGPLGPVGTMELGPANHPNLEIPAPLLNQAAAFVGTLIYLAQRDASLKYLATTDELTGAYNRRYLEHFLREVLERNQHEHTEVTLFLFDIDEFKYYNDTYGHTSGDAILQQITQLMRRCCRSHDVITRMGGDEFAVIFWDTGQRRKIYREHAEGNAAEENLSGPPVGSRSGQSHPEAVLFLSNRFRRIIQTSAFPSLGPDARGVLTISGGLASYPLDGKTVQELLAKADDALLQAKRSGKNRIYLVGQPK